MDPYEPVKTINDLIYQFNFIGYHQVCIFPERHEVVHSAPEYRKNVYVYYGHSEDNQTGKY